MATKKSKSARQSRGSARSSGAGRAKAKPPARSKAPARKKTAATQKTAAAPKSAPPSALTPEELREFEQMLLEKRAQLLGDSATLRSELLTGSRQDASGDLSSMPIHMADLGTDNYEREFTLGLMENNRALLREIDEALERIRNGTYGICVATGKPIGKARLRATPWTKYCYEYMLARETGKRI
jgi:DnaK suppressor protein